MTDWLKLFVERLSELVDPLPPLEFRDTSPPELAIPAAHPEVGELVVGDEGNELTVAIGRVYHTHFFPTFAEIREGRDLRTSSAPRAAAEFVAEVLADRILFEVVDCDVGEESPDRPPAGSRQEPSGGLYRWSGPVQDSSASPETGEPDVRPNS